MPHLANVPPAQPDAAFSLVAKFALDTNEKKVDLCPGFYRDQNSKPWVLPSVTQAKAKLHADHGILHEHLPLVGHAGLLRGSQKLVFGTTRDLERIASIQTVSGTGANHIAALFLSTRLKPRTVWISDPSWINHTKIWELVNPEIEQRSYPYYNKESHTIDFENMITNLRKEAIAGDVIILHACAHNPTGMDLDKQQWKVVADVCQELGLFAVFDLAYQGFATGDVYQDSWVINHFYDNSNLEFAVAQSFSKNFGLYGERVGVLHVVATSAETAIKVTPSLTQLTRAEITSCPSYGARIVAEILENPDLYSQWLQDLRTMSDRMKRMRRSLYEALQRKNVKGSWQYLLTDIGMFSMTGLSHTEVSILREKHHIYLLPSGRISVTGLTENNVETVAEAFQAVLGSE
ncbi:Bcaat2 [Botrytis cinerea B05.10]|uniref:Aspartate aminotransferase n=3 Tax=Botryotinia fuckeliana TaxID=40559 RepID=A0A384J4A9_BOTFB|nr:Bcaat2 [Botrytis cinerea B05.10]ATZ45342.1 Bcaat2 [Botrytis cinerea B05.10]EMR89907.1 putative aspartate aminotransferase protein [Botrytis cinerea BcDW1]CCD56460.1 similar to aspartate aminotransferase [Botrytis cinerea T4]